MAPPETNYSIEKQSVFSKGKTVMDRK